MQAQMQNKAPQGMMEQFQKLRPPSFKGESKPELAESWLEEMEKIFNAIQCPEEDKVRLAIFMLQDHAYIWWKATVRTIFEDHEVNWGEFIKALKDKFIPEHVRDQKEEEFMNLIQGPLSVAEYEAKFSALGKYAPHIFNDQSRKIKKFVRGLHSGIRCYVAAQDPQS